MMNIEKGSSLSVLILDSGVGGLSYLRCFLQLLREKGPHWASQSLKVIYGADTGFFPYSDKKPHEVRARMDALVAELGAHHHPQIIITACNSMSTHVPQEGFSSYAEPFTYFGVSPAVEEIPGDGAVLILSTELTAHSSFLDKKLAHLSAQGARGPWVRMGSSDLVELAEMRFFQNYAPSSCDADFFAAGDVERLRKRFSQSLRKVLLSQNVAVILLSCTHFIFAKKDIARVVAELSLPVTPKILCSSEEKARLHVRELMADPSVMALSSASRVAHPEVVFYSGYGENKRAAIREYLRALDCEVCFRGEVLARG